jgi:serine/threonine-protein kinase RsbW
MVIVRVPARSDYIGLLRSMVGRVAAHLRLPIDAIDDLQIAVDEAFALLLPLAAEPKTAALELDPSREWLRATLRMPVDVSRWPPQGLEGSLAWKVIEGLTDEAEVDARGGEAAVILVKRTLDQPGG